MQETIVTTLLLPLAIGFTMLGLGLDLAIAEMFRTASPRIAGEFSR